ncbi:hypothetical protein [Halomarina ordinaria]|uniref:Peptide ABC transporter ATP-binding protein n=1 Tax=Halomarina ordinaria TaxID=3033939 RepID=A0ABD5U7B4_9EURY|nr:hypothetical protein [Halomarina sp. PSRA2]
MARSAHPVDVAADLSLTIDGQPITVESYTDTVVVDLPSVRAAYALARSGWSRLDRTLAVLTDLDLTVLVCIDGTAVARLGADAHPGAVERLAPVELLPAGVLRASVAAPVRFVN